MSYFISAQPRVMQPRRNRGKMAEEAVEVFMSLRYFDASPRGGAQREDVAA